MSTYLKRDSRLSENLAATDEVGCRYKISSRRGGATVLYQNRKASFKRVSGDILDLNFLSRTDVDKCIKISKQFSEFLFCLSSPFNIQTHTGPKQIELNERIKLSFPLFASQVSNHRDGIRC